MNEGADEDEDRQIMRLPQPGREVWFTYREGMRYDDVPRNVTHVVVEDGATEILEEAFNSYMEGWDGDHDDSQDFLRYVKLASSVQSIGQQSFMLCTKLLKFDIPPDSRLATIGAFAFNQSGLETMTLPVSLQLIEGYAFTSMPRLTKIDFQADSDHPSQLESLGMLCFCDCKALKEVNLSHCPGLRAISNRSFFDCHSLKAEAVSLPPNLQQIDYQAFHACFALAEIAFPRTLETIGKAAFAHCRNLKSLIFPAGLRNVEPLAFEGCLALQVVTFDSFQAIRAIMTRSRQNDERVNVFWGCSALHTIQWPSKPQQGQQILPALWPRLLLGLFLSDNGLLGYSPDAAANRLSCVFSFLCRNREELLENQCWENATASRRRQPADGLDLSAPKKQQRN